MQVISTIADIRAARAGFPRLGFVPTMGFLHEGHLNLVRQAKAECGAVAVSIFVNPLQFGPKEDLATYPRDLERDLALLRSVECDLVWTPTVEDIYPSGFSSYVDVDGVTAVLEGERRPGHFRGVATVVAKLFNVVQPTRAYFGQKDAQQTVVLRKMVRDLAFPLELIVAPTTREADGLAMSSRNTYLSPHERQAATILIRSLQAAEAAWQAGERSAASLKQIMTAFLASEPLANVDYVSIADRDTLEELTLIDPTIGAWASLAVRIGRTRLIDNLILVPLE